MTLSLVLMYAIAVLLIVGCVIKDMRRSLLRGCVALVLTLFAIPVAAVITHNVIDRITSGVMHTLDLSSIDPLARAFPSLEEGAVALVHMVAAPEVWRIVFLLLYAVLSIAAWLICRAIVNKKPEWGKKSKPIGAAIGVVGGLVLTVALLTPTAGYATIAPELVHIAGEVEQIQHTGKEDVSDQIATIEGEAYDVSKTPLLAAVRALGGDAMFRSLTYVTVNGEGTNLQKEEHAINVLGEDIAALTAVPMGEYGDAEYDTLKNVGRAFEQSLLLRVLGAEGLSELSRAWLKGDTFLNIPKPDMGTATNVALDAAMHVLKNTTKDTIVADLRGIAPAAATALRTMNTLANVTKPQEPSQNPEQGGEETTPATPMDMVGELVDAIVENADSPEVKDALIKAGIGIIANEYKDVLLGGGTSETPADPDAPVKPTDPTVPELSGADLELTQEQYDAFVAQLTDLVLDGIMSLSEEEIVEQVKSVRDASGLPISDEQCQTLVEEVLNSPYASVFR